MGKIQVYLSARISLDAHFWNNFVCDLLDERFEVFKPHEHNPYNIDHKHLAKSVYEMDLEAMKKSDIGLLLTPHGRDCAWEVGWYSKSNKPIVLYADNDTTWFRDWMIKGGIDKVITSKDWLFNLLKKDDIVKDKIKLIDSRSKLSDAFYEVYQNNLENQK